MAVKDSEELKSDERYPLGDYSFRIERTSVPGSTNDKIEAICTDKDGKNARKSIQVSSSTQLDGWYVEANETEASVYALVKIPPDSPVTGTIQSTTIAATAVSTDNGVQVGTNGNQILYLNLRTAMECTLVESSGHIVGASKSYAPGSCWYNRRPGSGIGSGIYPYTYHNKTVYYWEAYISSGDNLNLPVSNVTPDRQWGAIAWAIIYGTQEPTEKEVLVARFAIDLEDAGGVGPGSDWIDPGDYDPDWEPEDPTHTLYVTVTGALSGRHNDPIEDPSYSYIPADKDTVKDYGCGGDGGHGGGGGAGASTVVVHKFATNQADSKEVTAIARRHGYGSGGGKGGKGGDGCILVYY